MVDEDRRARRTARESAGSPRPCAPSPIREARLPARRAARRAAGRRLRARPRPGAARELRGRRPSSSTARRAPRTRSRSPRRRASTRDSCPCAHGSSPRCRTPRAPRSPAPSGMCDAGPSARDGSRPSRAGPPRMRGSSRAAGRTNPLSTLKNVVLPAPFGPIRPHAPSGNVTVMSSSGVTPPKRTVSPSTSITLPAPPASARAAADQAARASSGPRGTWSTSPPGSRREHLEDADPEQKRARRRCETPQFSSSAGSSRRAGPRQPHPTRCRSRPSAPPPAARSSPGSGMRSATASPRWRRAGRPRRPS